MGNVNDGFHFHYRHFSLNRCKHFDGFTNQFRKRCTFIKVLTVAAAAGKVTAMKEEAEE
jgi:hypothetical protein